LLDFVLALGHGQTLPNDCCLRTSIPRRGYASDRLRVARELPIGCKAATGSFGRLGGTRKASGQFSRRQRRSGRPSGAPKRTTGRYEGQSPSAALGRQQRWLKAARVTGLVEQAGIPHVLDHGAELPTKNYWTE